MEKTREEFVRRVLSHEKSKAALCREYGISRPTGDKWIKRFENGESLSDKSRKPFHTANKINDEVEQKIISARKEEPAIGATKTRRMLVNSGWSNPPSISTINAVFKRNGLIETEASLKSTPITRFEKESPNDMWQGDFKGNYLMRNQERCNPLSIVDDHSRYCLCADAKKDMQYAGTRESFERTFRTYGLPKILLCDNGVPWGSSQSGSITRFEVWLMELGILTIHIRVRHPQTQGKVERFNRSFKDERLKFYTPTDLADANRQRLEYREFYNNKRPHYALGLDVPAAHYVASERKYPDKIEEWEYEPNSEIRKVKSSGYISYNGQGYYLSEGLGNKEVAIIPSKQDGVLNIIFRQYRVAKLDLRENMIISRRIYLLHDDPRNEGK